MQMILKGAELLRRNIANVVRAHTDYEHTVNKDVALLMADEMKREYAKRHWTGFARATRVDASGKDVSVIVNDSGAGFQEFGVSHGWNMAAKNKRIMGVQRSYGHRFAGLKAKGYPIIMGGKFALIGKRAIHPGLKARPVIPTAAKGVGPRLPVAAQGLMGALDRLITPPQEGLHAD
ncbi:MAG TPA: hypothetical protein VMX74_14755 [Pirellulales bacterium]|nr:hypothetical protein [Pirellulales bacterium]